MSEQIEPVPVHITGSDLAADISKVRPKRMSISPHTVVLTANAPVQTLCGQEPNRKLVKVMAIDHAIVLCDSYAQAAQVANTDVNLANPEGGYLPVSTEFNDFETTEQLWVAASTFPTRVAVMLISYAEA